MTSRRYFNFSLLAFVSNANLVARLVISSILFTVTVAFVLRPAVVTKKVILGILFLTSVHLVF